jgi:TonB family protein
MRWKIGIWTLIAVMALAAAGVAQEPGAPQGTPQESRQGPQGGPTPDTEKPTRIRIGGDVMQPKEISTTPPIYPPLARQARIQGTVVLHAIIRKDGTVQEVSVISGHPLLARAAEDAVLQWKYEPTLLNGEPVEVETTVTVHFVMDQNPPEQPAPPAEQSPAPGPSTEQGPPIDPQLKADILHLFDVMHLRDKQSGVAKDISSTYNPLFSSSLPMTPNRGKIIDAIVGKMIALTQSDDYLDNLAAIYAEHLSDDDVKGLTAFYESPAGQHYSAAEFRIATQSVRLEGLITWTGLTGIITEICGEYPELQGKVDYCPKVAPEHGKQSLLREPERVPLSGDAQ